MTARKRQAWNFTPDLPLRSAPFLHWPLQPAAIARHLVKTWRPLTSRVVMLVVAFALWEWFRPSLAEAGSLRLGWILEIWGRNVVLVTVVAGGLHLLLQRCRVQGDGLRYDGRPLTKNKNGGLESPLDELIGAFHDGTTEGDQMVAERLRRLSASRQPSRDARVRG